VIPLLTLFAAQFPDIGAVILKWIDPVRKLCRESLLPYFLSTATPRPQASH
jgi:hypothetical protein